MSNWSIYNANAEQLTAGLQGPEVCDEAKIAAQRLANDRGELKTPSGDASEQAAEWSRRARTYISEHLGDLPRVELARLGRVFELYHPGSPWGPINGDQKIAFDVYEGRAEYAARIALAQYYVLMPLAIAGGVILWRRSRAA